MYAASRVWTRSTQEGVDRGKCCAADAAVIDGRTNECAAPQMQRQVDELEAEADQIADVSGEAAAEYHRLRQVLDRMSQIFCSCCSMCLCNGKHGSLHLLASKRRTERHISPSFAHAASTFSSRVRAHNMLFNAAGHLGAGGGDPAGDAAPGEAAALPAPRPPGEPLQSCLMAP